MTTAEVRKLIGNPIEINGSGAFWEYGQGGNTPDVHFNVTVENGVLAADVMSSLDSDISSCD